MRAGDPPAATLALVAAVAVQETLAVLAPAADPRIKWPNDILIGDAKLSGMLLERAGDAVVIGIGINIAHHPEDIGRRATSLSAMGCDVDASATLDILAEAFARWLGLWRSGGIAPVRARWLERAHPLGTALAATQAEGSRIEGLFDGLDGDGALMLRLASGERRAIHAGDVFLI